ncbi:MAG: NAD(P)-dependent oxidoreductase [Actinobacteria bacterium]|nr:NAD(P)-dependent oxidoreductase [Actinomycetota bacterium]
MTRVLVLGAQGFLGRAAWGTLVDAGHQVVAHVRRPLAAPQAAVLTPWCAAELDTASHAEVRELIEHSGAEVVVNCVGATTGSVRELRAANLTVVEHVTGVVARLRGVRYIHLGSAAEYGVGRPGQPVRETDVPHPISEYGATKLAATALVMERARTDGFAAVVLRVFNPVGPGAPTTSVAGRAAAELRRAVLAREREIRLGSLDSWRDYVGVGDVAGAIAVVVNRPLDDGAHVVNVGSGRAQSTRALIARLSEIAEFRGSIVESAPSSARSEGVDWQEADITVLQERYGFQPRQTTDDMLRGLWREAPVGV